MHKYSGTEIVVEGKYLTCLINYLLTRCLGNQTQSSGKRQERELFILLAAAKETCNIAWRLKRESPTVDTEQTIVRSMWWKISDKD